MSAFAIGNTAGTGNTAADQHHHHDHHRCYHCHRRRMGCRAVTRSMRFDLPRIDLPPCISVLLPAKAAAVRVLESYSLISHPAATGTFDLAVKSYPYQDGGGVGSYLCSLSSSSSPPSSSVRARVKEPRRFFYLLLVCSVIADDAAVAIAVVVPHVGRLLSLR